MADKDVTEVRYPQSAELFRFCKEALAIKHKNGVKVIDQHVGAILGFDPADCSHWKRGKKSIRSLNTVNTIAKHLEVDKRLVTDLIAGRTDVPESLQEFRGYGPTELSTGFYEELKREYFRDPASFAVNDKSPSLDEITTIDGAAISKVAEALLSRASISSCPVLIPEVLAALPDVRIETVLPVASGQPGDEARAEPPEQAEPVVLTGGPGAWVIRVQPGTDQRPYGRFLIAKAIGRSVLDPQRPLGENDERTESRSNHFAAALLMPFQLFNLVMREVDDTRDVVAQLAEAFWVSRSAVNLRLKNLMGRLA